VRQPGQWTSTHGTPATIAARIVGDHQTSSPAAMALFQRSTTRTASPRAVWPHGLPAHGGNHVEGAIADAHEGRLPASPPPFPADDVEKRRGARTSCGRATRYLHSLQPQQNQTEQERAAA
jgi:hypothetical protein